MATNKIIKNSAFLYARMILLLGIGFYTTRIFLEALGVEDLGIYNVIGSLIVMFDFISSGLTNSTQRFINIGLGKNDMVVTNQYFSHSLQLHIIFALIIVVLAETIGLWFLYYKLVIPANRFTAALWCYQITVVSLVLRLVKICYESDIIAREDMSIYAYLSIFESLAKLAICFILIHNSSFDNLIMYCVLLFVVNVIITLINIIYCNKKYEESRFRLCNDRSIYKQLLSFVGINSLGVISWAIGRQGVDILINLFFGPVVNGAKSIASNLDRVVVQFASNLQIAVRPQITKLYAQGNLNEMVDLGMRSSKLIFYVMLIIAIPFLFHTDNILFIWLGEVPKYSCIFVKILIVEALFYTIGNTFYAVTNATGKIFRTQVYGRLITLSTIPISYFILLFIDNEYIPSIVLTITSCIYSYFIIYDANKILGFGILKFFKTVYSPLLIVSAIVYLISYYISKFIMFDSIVLNTIVNSVLLCLTALFVIIMIGINKEERQYIKQLVTKIVKK